MFCEIVRPPEKSSNLLWLDEQMMILNDQLGDKDYDSWDRRMQVHLNVP